MSSPNAWFSRPWGNPSARVRLFCFPFAGGAASAYLPWAQEWRGRPVEVCAVQLPGRENRLRERPIESMDEMAERIAQSMLAMLDLPFAFFGHSMGALIAFEVTRRLRSLGAAAPELVVVSGSRPPEAYEKDPPIHALPDLEFLAVVRDRYQSIPDEVLSQPELLELAMPKLRGDFTLIETYRYAETEPLSMRVLAWGGDEDPLVSVGALDGWHRHCGGEFGTAVFRGGHFFIRDDRTEVLGRLRRELGLG